MTRKPAIRSARLAVSAAPIRLEQDRDTVTAKPVTHFAHFVGPNWFAIQVALRRLAGEATQHDVLGHRLDSLRDHSYVVTFFLAR